MSNTGYQQLPQPLLANQYGAPVAGAPPAENTTSVQQQAPEHVAVAIQQPMYGQPLPQQQQPAYGQPQYYGGRVYPQMDHLLMTMPAHVGVGVKILVGFSLLLYVALAVVYYFLNIFDNYWWIWLLFAALLTFLVWYRYPRACDVSTHGISVHLNGPTYSLLYENMTSGTTETRAAAAEASGKCSASPSLLLSFSSLFL